ncbi:unnamed protein product [Phytomonas sp. EM1]|nr:unnamed protein product [Phytomonas sp. EM1]|eukprot:CCW61646.1 unnamed protein product [Phytomonas sp. isolate EM1]
MLRHSVSRYSPTPGLVSSGESLLRKSESTLHRIQRRDITLRIPSRDGLLRVAFCSSKMLLFETIWRHRILDAKPVNIPFLQLLGTHLSLTNLLASLQEGEERVICRFTGREATIVTEALALGECRCYLKNDSNNVLAGSTCATFPLKVDRILYNQTKPFTSIVNADLERLSECESTLQSKNSGLAHMDALDEIIALLKKGVLKPSSCLLPSSPLLGLRGLKSLSPQVLEVFFNYNISLHGYNLFRQSDGCAAAIFAHTSLSAQRIEELARALMCEESEIENHKAKWLTALPSIIPLSFGVVVQPLAAGNVIEWQLWRLQSALMQAGTALATTETRIHRIPDDVLALRDLFERCAATHTTCQYILSLISGDYEGAHAASARARQFTHPIEEVTAIVQPLRRALDINDISIELNASAAVRTGLDFFCRCSTANLLQTLVDVPEGALQELMLTNEFHCTYCGKVLRAMPEEWEYLMERRAKHFVGKS